MLAEENADDDYAEEKVSEDVPDSDFDVRGTLYCRAAREPHFQHHPISTASMQEEEDDDDDEGDGEDVEERPR